MNKNINALVIVEGKRAEPSFFKMLENTYGLNLQFFCVESNIYLLYKKIKDGWGVFDIKQLLLEIHNEAQYRDMLQKDFAYTYLIFDCDAHHREVYEKNSPIEDIVGKNIERVAEMLKYFNDETDPTRGKLYINYPMFESLKDADACFEDDYANRYVLLEQLNDYKKIVGTKKLSNKRIDTYNREDINNLIKMNLFKLNYLVTGCWCAMDYPKYIVNSIGVSIHSVETNEVNSNKRLAVLNTSLFLILDYFGDRNEFYTETICTSNRCG